ncbi:hypothetical protein AVEN_27538-1, partial [Araneus ventricosus]
MAHVQQKACLAHLGFYGSKSIVTVQRIVQLEQLSGNSLVKRAKDQQHN